MICRLQAHPRINSLTLGLLLAGVLLTFSATLDASPALAAGIIATDPITNEIGVDPDAAIEVTYDSPISPTTVTTRTFVVQGMQSGARDGAFHFSDEYRRFTLHPGSAFFAGEVVRVSATGGISDTSGFPATPYQWQFTAGPVFERHFGGFIDVGAGLLDVACGAGAWGDYDGDGDLDILLTGLQYDAGYTAFAGVYRSDGGQFTAIETGLPGVWGNSAAWGDYDNDGDLDILITGSTGRGPISRVYRNDEGAFIDIGAGLAEVTEGAVAWGDYDNDGDLDILLTGGDTRNGPVSRLYRNDDGTFIDIGAGLTDVSLSAVAWGDYDNDGDLDILLAGAASSGFVSQVWRNDDGAFFDIGAGLPGVGQGSVAWGDYDNDGDPDILVVGIELDNNRVARVYRNERGAFIDTGAGVRAVHQCSVVWGDYDNDGDLDILLTGAQDKYAEHPLAALYRNDEGNFTEISVGLPAVYYGSVAWGDYDSDGDLDILFSGFTGSELVTAVYRNEDYVAYFPVICRNAVTLPNPGVTDLSATVTEMQDDSGRE